MIRIALAYSSRLISGSLRSALDKIEDLYVVGCATTSEELHFLLPQCDVVLLGAELVDKPAIEVLREISLTHSRIKTLVLGVDACEETIIRYIEAGATGYVLQNESIEDIVRKVNAAHKEQAIVSPKIAAAIMDRLAYLAKMEVPLGFIQSRRTQLAELTDREGEVLDLIARGLSNKQIADRLVIEYGTVKNHVHNILKKLDVRSRQEAASIYRAHRRPQQKAAMATQTLRPREQGRVEAQASTASSL